MESYLPVIWAAIIGLAVAIYVIFDGFDLGIGILFPFAETERERDQMMNSVAPFWDGNETWLVLGGAGMMVAFPLAYSIILPALYLPVIIMLLALVFRGVAFEFRWIGVTSKPHWTFAFAAGSALAAFCQGLILGGLIQGIKMENRALQAEAVTGKPSAFRAVALGTQVPRTLQGKLPAIAVNNLADFSVGGKGPQTSPISNAFQAMYDESTDTMLHGTGQETFEAVKMLKAADPAHYQPAPGVVYPHPRAEE